MDVQGLKVRRMVMISLMAAASVMLAKFARFPIFPAAPFLKLDIGEVPLLIAACMLGTRDGFTSLVVKEFLSLILFGTNIFGVTADFLACGTFLLVFSKVVHSSASPGRMLCGVIVGALVRMAASVPINLVILQLQYASSVEAIWAQMVYIIPFNGIKCALNGACAAAVFKYIPGIKSQWAAASE